MTDGAIGTSELGSGPTRLDLLKQSYSEVLDATKHQDDKIGRILAAVSFLAAAAIALVNASGIGVARQFTLGDRTLPLLAYAFVAFVVGVVFSVTLLLSSVTTSLTLPGRRSGGQRGDSLVYFFPISRRRLKDWHGEWAAARPALAARFEDGFVDEIYNLAVRTNHKYRRTGEAVALLRLTLFSLGAAVMFAGAVATAPPRPVAPGEPPPAVTVDAGLTVGFAAYVAAYTFVVVLMARRDNMLEARVADTPDGRPRRVRVIDMLALQVVPPLAAAALIANRFNVVRVLVPLLIVTGAVLLLVSLWSHRKPVERGALLVTVAIATVLVLRALIQPEPAWRWLAAVGIPVVLTVVDLTLVEQKIRKALALPRA